MAGTRLSGRFGRKNPAHFTSADASSVCVTANHSFTNIAALY
jgi:hypothetical protein